MPVRLSRLARLGVLPLAGLVAACAGAPATPAPTVAIPADAIRVTATEYEFAPATLSVPAGAVTFAVTNAGSENHEFEVVQGETTIGKIDGFARQTTEALAVTLAAGDYTFVCRLNGHDILGMKGTLTVTGG